MDDLGASVVQIVQEPELLGPTVTFWVVLVTSAQVCLAVRN